MRIWRAVLLPRRAHQILPEQDVGRCELFNRGVAEVRLDPLSEQGLLLHPGARGHGRLDVSLVGFEETRQRERSQAGCGLKLLLFGLEASFGGTPGDAVDVLEPAGHPPAVSRPVFVDAHFRLLSLDEFATKMQSLERRMGYLRRICFAVKVMSDKEFIL